MQTNNTDCNCFANLYSLICVLNSNPTDFKFSTQNEVNVLRQYFGYCYHSNTILERDFLNCRVVVNPILYENVFFCF